MNTIDTTEALRQHQRLAHERVFESAVKEYILNPQRKYQYGGVVNLLTTVRSVIEKISDEADYHGLDPVALQFAVDQINALTYECDTRYSVQLS